MRRLSALAAACLVSIAVGAQAPAPSAPEAPVKPAPPAARISDLSWLVGYWVGEGLGGTVEDVWLPAKAGVLLGAFRLVKADGKPGVFAFGGVTFEQKGESGLVVRLVIRRKDGTQRHEALAFRRKTL